MVGYANAILRWRWLLIALVWAGVIAASYGVRYAVTRSDYRYEFTEDNPQLLAFEAMENVYGANDSVFFFVAPESDDVFNPETLAAVLWLTSSPGRSPTRHGSIRSRTTSTPRPSATTSRSWI